MNNATLEERKNKIKTIYLENLTVEKNYQPCQLMEDNLSFEKTENLNSVMGELRMFLDRKCVVDEQLIRKK